MAETFITLEQAAKLEGVSYETMKKRIQRNPGEFKISKEPGENGGKDRVTVSLSYLSSKARKAYKARQKVDVEGTKMEQKSQESLWYLNIDLNWYIENHKREYYEAVELSKRVQEFVEYGEGERTAYAETFAEGLEISKRTLYRYAESYLEASAWAAKLEHEEGECFDFFKVLALCRKPKESNTFPSLTDEQRALIENIWFDKEFANNDGTIEMLFWKFEEVAERKGWEDYPSIKTVARYIKYLMDELQGRNAHYLAANGMRAFKNARMLKGKRDTTALQVMEFVQGDEHTFDCWVQYTHPNGKIKAVRPKLVAWLDTRSRCIMGDVLCVDANSQILKESLVKMLYSHPGGVPKHLHIDNGKDYTSKTNTGQSRKERQMQELEFDSESKGFYRSIGIDEWSRSLPYEPWSKGQIERLFGTVCSMFTKWMASYVGTLTGSKTSGKRKKDISGMLERGELLTMEEFYECWTKWKNEVYHKREHSSLKKDREKYITPIELFEKAERYYKASPPREYAAMLLLKADSSLVRNQGIYKFGTLYTAYELCYYIGQNVNIKWDIDDVTRLYVFDKNGKKICEAISAELLQIAPRVPQAALEEHIRKQKTQLRDTKEKLEWYQTPHELRVQDEQGTPTVVGGVDLTVKAKRNDKLIQLPNDKEFREEVKAGSISKKQKQHKESDDEFLNKKAQTALKRLRALG
ncbi:bacteriophage Mu transposase [Ruminiclostridium sufflavum DSM 19573]|uniref:Bacteriophage Mu transposase n=1 Tax=Ruminiclostridium sufflavum DSM 19573 TaxID=1121337 RepID=A0A318XHN3_9FIRM|nr:Mu transposase C-terminal domain-containing protein [Ruminiclostridium sufflavum]PYG86710.1 bacteriophage Mu transposase [Ruminiclostridium sufflavum DSM 19573]